MNRRCERASSSAVTEPEPGSAPGGSMGCAGGGRWPSAGSALSLLLELDSPTRMVQILYVDTTLGCDSDVLSSDSRATRLPRTRPGFVTGLCSLHSPLLQLCDNQIRCSWQRRAPVRLAQARPTHRGAGAPAPERANPHLPGCRRNENEGRPGAVLARSGSLRSAQRCRAWLLTEDEPTAGQSRPALDRRSY